MYPKLNLPDFEFKIINQDKTLKIFDIIRKKYIILTPEEWVRQNLVRFLIYNLNYPPALIGIEKQINVFNTVKRPDIVIYDSKISPVLVAECKRPEIEINNDTLNQAVNYYLELNPKYILLSNGFRHYCCKITDKKLTFLDNIPTYENL